MKHGPFKLEIHKLGKSSFHKINILNAHDDAWIAEIRRPYSNVNIQWGMEIGELFAAAPETAAERDMLKIELSNYAYQIDSAKRERDSAEKERDQLKEENERLKLESSVRLEALKAIAEWCESMRYSPDEYYSAKKLIQKPTIGG